MTDALTLTRPPVLDEVRDAIEEVVPRICRLVRSTERPDASAIGVWSAVETAVHLMQTMEADIGAVTESFSAQDRARFEDLELQQLDELTQGMVREEPERDPGELARRMAEAADALAAELGAAGDDRLVTWLGGMQLPLSAVGAHVVEEALVHGRDIARSQGRRWPIEPSHAAVAVGRFLFRVMEATDPAGFVDADAAAGFNAAFEFRVRGTGRFYFVFEEGALRVERAYTGPVDVHVSADPATFLLVQLNRTKPLRPALTGRMVVWGRRPWLLGRLSQLVKGP